MLLVITGVGSLIHLFSVGYMKADAGYARYFAYLNLFVVFMLVLVLGASFPVMFIGWEGVGLCSYLLIGFWFSEKANADAGKKAFIVNRIGDFGFLIAMFLIWRHFGTLDFAEVVERAPQVLPAGRRAGHRDHAVPLPRLRRQVGPDPALHLAAGRHGRPDAGLGADPRRHDGHGRRVPRGADQRALRAGARSASTVVAGVGALTALFAATIGLRQYDIKKVLAYSTVSQLGLHVPRRGHRRVRRRHLPPGDPRLLQGAAVPRRGQRDPRDAPRLSRHPQPRGRPGHAQHGRAPASTCR